MGPIGEGDVPLAPGDSPDDVTVLVPVAGVVDVAANSREGVGVSCVRSSPPDVRSWWVDGGNEETIGVLSWSKVLGLGCSASGFRVTGGSAARPAERQDHSVK